MADAAGWILERKNGQTPYDREVYTPEEECLQDFNKFKIIGRKLRSMLNFKNGEGSLFGPTT